jgi:hypothetical protein
MDCPVKSKALLIQVERRIFLIRGQNVMLDSSWRSFMALRHAP